MSDSDHPSSKKKPMFCMEPAIYVRIDHKEGLDLARRFMRWCLDQDICGFRGSSIGPTGYVGFFYPEYADEIRAWLKENKATEYSWSDGEEL